MKHAFSFFGVDTHLIMVIFMKADTSTQKQHMKEEKRKETYKISYLVTINFQV